MRRVLAPLLASLVLAAPASAQVGDEQYSDPLAQPDQGQTAPQTEEIPGVAQEQQPTLSDTPVGDGPTSAPSSGSAGTTADAAPQASGVTQLPNTGADARVLAGLGVILLLVGIGLRLRTADGSF